MAADRTKTESLRAAITRLSADFAGAGLATPALDARLLVLVACGLTHEAYILNPDRAMDYAETHAAGAMRARRLAGEPVSRIIGRREFWGLDFAIGEAVLDPRPDTETLVQSALDIVDEEGRRGAELRIADLGTGSGCILLSMLRELPGASGVGVDISPEALAVARRNAALLGLEARADFTAGNWCENLSGGFDVIVTNPPYIESEVIGDLEPEVRLYDPRQALDGGDDGLDAYREIAASSLDSLRPGGWILLEAGAGQANAILSIFDNGPWRNRIASKRINRDLNGINRVVAIKRQD
jgi:release factor glutamine methyltransferase